MIYFNQSGEPVLEIVFGDDVSGKIPKKFYEDLCNRKVSAKLHFVDGNLSGIEFEYRELGGIVTLGD